MKPQTGSATFDYVLIVAIPAIAGLVGFIAGSLQQILQGWF